MKYRLLSLVVLAILLPGVAYAHELTSQEALGRALSTLSAVNSNISMSKALNTGSSAFSLSYTQMGSQNIPLLYVYSKNGGGFVIAGADSRADALLGYSDNGSFDALQDNPAFQGWLTDCTNALQWLSLQPEREQTTESTVLTTAVAPLLGDIAWSQEAPYNNLCPEKTYTNKTKRAPTGCVATAIAQVMGSFKWPLTGEGSHTNSSDTTQHVDFSQSTYEWSKMKPTYDGTETGDSADAIAKLMYDVGCAVDMRYGYSLSGSLTIMALEALTSYFRYDKGMRYEKRTYFSSDDWNAMLRNELDNRRPIIMGAGSSSGSHEFVIDGYDERGLYHVNWGWNGTSNGYFDVNYFNPPIQGVGGNDGMYFNHSQEVIINIQKDEMGTSVGHPDLRSLYDHISYKYSMKQFVCTLSNQGTGDFSGEAGFVVTDTVNNIVAMMPQSFAETPIKPFGYQALRLSLPDNVKINEGYTVKPYYKLSADGEAMDLISPQTGDIVLVAHIDADSVIWKFGDEKTAPQITCTDIQVIRGYTGYNPCFRATIANSKDSKKEYNDNLTIEVTATDSNNKETRYCYGYVQCFIRPGETATYDIECDRSLETITDSTYNFTLSAKYGEADYIVPNSDGNPTVGTITMVTPAPSDITYSDLAVDKAEIMRGDTITASFKATNAGGYAYLEYRFNIYTDDSLHNHVGYLPSKSYDILGGQETTALFTGPVDIAPGNYLGKFFVYKTSEKKWGSISKTTCSITVKESAPSAIEGISCKDQSATNSGVVRKLLRNGHLIIIKNGNEYNLLGVKE